MDKKLIIGVDEAGYGPKLGPLVIGGSAWLVPQNLSEQDFVAAFDQDFSTKSWSPGCKHIPLGDSKKLHRAGGKGNCGLVPLEAGLLAMMQSMGPLPNCVHQLIDWLSHDRQKSASLARSLSLLESPLPWYENLREYPVPSWNGYPTGEITRLANRATDGLSVFDIELVAIQARVVTETEFNECVSELDSKGRLLSNATFDLISQLTNTVDCTSCEIYCDRQGGRKNYLPLLLDWCPDAWFVETRKQNDRCSYRSTSARQMEIHFTVGGDSFPATALASMTAKYLRERLMESFNHFWSHRCEGLKPTAGYPVDAERFRNDVRQTAQLFALPENLWWRCR